MRNLSKWDCYGPNIRSLSRTTLHHMPNLKRLKALAFTVFFVSMFSLFSQAQPADSQAAALGVQKPLMVGASVPEDFWTKEHLFYVNGDTITKSIDDYKGKLIILDFWATWCTICWTQIPKNEALVTSYNGDIIVLLVDTKSTKDDFNKIKATHNKYLKGMGIDTLSSIIEDDYFQTLFPVEGYPKYMWISPSGHFIASTGRISVTKGHIDSILENFKPKK